MIRFRFLFVFVVHFGGLARLYASDEARCGQTMARFLQAKPEDGTLDSKVAVRDNQILANLNRQITASIVGEDSLQIYKRDWSAVVDQANGNHLLSYGFVPQESNFDPLNPQSIFEPRVLVKLHAEKNAHLVRLYLPQDSGNAWKDLNLLNPVLTDLLERASPSEDFPDPPYEEFLIEISDAHLIHQLNMRFRDLLEEAEIDSTLRPAKRTNHTEAFEHLFSDSILNFNIGQSNTLDEFFKASSPEDFTKALEKIFNQSVLGGNLRRLVSNEWEMSLVVDVANRDDDTAETEWVPPLIIRYRIMLRLKAKLSEQS